MTLAELLALDRVLLDVSASGKAHLLEVLAREAAARLPVEAPAVAAALVARERLGSTGLGRGFALPHARLEGVTRPCGLFARLRRPIGFEAIDGEPVDLVFLLLIPPGSADHVAALAAVTRALRDEALVRELRRSRSAPAVFRLLAGQGG